MANIYEITLWKKFCAIILCGYYMKCAFSCTTHPEIGAKTSIFAEGSTCRGRICVYALQFVCTCRNSCVYTAICCLVCFMRRLHQEHRCKAGEEGYGAVDELGPEETLLAFGKEWDGGVTVLGDAACQQHRERNDSGGE